QGRYVFTIERTGDALGTVHRQPVSVGELVSEGLEIVEGLEDGDLVVTAGVTQIAEGRQVKLLPEYQD
ncbi:MAG: efflux RND transporter periplasmic adaptor subunit, partial [bacterium]|nr:efflux RND transporter periplasmic adaptor subunit [bacterium]